MYFFYFQYQWSGDFFLRDKGIKHVLQRKPEKIVSSKLFVTFLPLLFIRRGLRQTQNTITGTLMSSKEFEFLRCNVPNRFNHFRDLKLMQEHLKN